MIQNTKNNNKNSFNNINSNNITVNNSLNLKVPKTCLEKSNVYDLLDMFNKSKTKAEDTPNFSSKHLVYLPTKLKFNHAPKYNILFKEYGGYFEPFVEVLYQFANSEKIIRKVRTIYLNVADYSDDGIVVGNGDSQLDKIKNEIKNLIMNDPRYDNSIYSETIDTMIYCLMARCAELCKILVKPSDVKQ